MAQRAQEFPQLEKNTKRLLEVISKERETSTKGEPSVRLSIALWLPAILLYDFGDLITTWLDAKVWLSGCPMHLIEVALSGSKEGAVLPIDKAIQPL